MNARQYIETWNVKSTLDEQLNYLKNLIQHFYINKDLIDLLNQFVGSIQDYQKKLEILLFCEKIIRQSVRVPDKQFYDAFEDEFKDDERQFSEEQRKYNPLEWVRAEIHYLKSQEKPVVEAAEKIYAVDKEILNLEECMHLLDMSKSTLDRRREEGLPHFKKGKKLYFRKSEILKWLEKSKW